MTADEAWVAAEALVAGPDLKGYCYELAEAKQQQRFPGRWTVLFDVFSPLGTLVDGPVVVMVDEKDARASFAQSA